MRYVGVAADAGGRAGHPGFDGVRDSRGRWDRPSRGYADRDAGGHLFAAVAVRLTPQTILPCGSREVRGRRAGQSLRAQRYQEAVRLQKGKSPSCVSGFHVPIAALELNSNKFLLCLEERKPLELRIGGASRAGQGSHQGQGPWPAFSLSQATGLTWACCKDLTPCGRAFFISGCPRCPTFIRWRRSDVASECGACAGAQRVRGARIHAGPAAGADQDVLVGIKATIPQLTAHSR